MTPMFRSFSILVCFAASASLSVLAVEPQHQETKTSSGRSIINQVKRTTLSQEPTEVERSLPLQEGPVLTCRSKDGNFEVVFDKDTGFEKAKLIENGKVLAEGLGCRAPRSTSFGYIYETECSSEGDSGYLVSFSYPVGGSLHLGKLFDLNHGRRYSRGQVVCEN
jgi:hypothetical protein